MRTFVRVAAIGAILASPAPALAQSAPAPLTLPGAAAPPADQALRRPILPQTGTMQLRAIFAETRQVIGSGLIWRIFQENGDGEPPTLIERREEPALSLNLLPGNYIVHVAYGYASATRRITMQWSDLNEIVAISAGALMVRGVVGESPIAPSAITYAVYVPLANDPEGRLVAAGVNGEEIMRLPEGSYHVVSTYGEANATMRSNVEVEAGQITEATLNHRAATVTLKLVATPGGEAYAGTAFSVLTPGGDVVREAIGAFPSVTLAEGEYVVIARHDGRVFTREFAIQSGYNRDIEVVSAEDMLRTPAASDEAAPDAP
ncbi:MAG: hypothetical protein MEP57_07000 [Microvirga sp.]|nr:hypothetical protein [Microvirga sp.]